MSIKIKSQKVGNVGKKYEIMFPTFLTLELMQQTI